MTQKSKCSSLCIDNVKADPDDGRASTTNTSMLICKDWELDGPNSTVTGRKWNDCLSCESSSNATDQNLSRGNQENDVYWFLCELYPCEDTEA